jgi:hypothetical protein
MNTSKYPLEICWCPLPFWYSTPSHILDQTTPYFNLLAAARTQGRIDVIIWSSLFGGDVAGLSIAIRYGTFQSDASTRNLVTTIESSCDGSLSRLRFWARILNQIAILTVFSSFWISYENRNSARRNLIIEEDCYFIAPKPIRLSSYSKSCQLVISCESFQGWLPVAHFAELEPKWRYRDSLVAIDHYQWPILGRYHFEAYLAPHPLDSPCASHTPLAIQEHLVVALTLLVSIVPKCYPVS